MPLMETVQPRTSKAVETRTSRICKLRQDACCCSRRTALAARALVQPRMSQARHCLAALQAEGLWPAASGHPRASCQRRAVSRTPHVSCALDSSCPQKRGVVFGRPLRTSFTATSGEVAAKPTSLGVVRLTSYEKNIKAGVASKREKDEMDPTISTMGIQIPSTWLRNKTEKQGLKDRCELFMGLRVLCLT